MAFNHTLSAILRGRWLLHKEWANDNLSLVLLMLEGKPVSFVDRSGNEGVELPFAVDPSTMERHPLYKWVDEVGMVPNPNIPANSVGIIPMSGPLTKYNGDCGEPGMIQRTNWLMNLQSRNNISSIVLLQDTPGGEARAANTFVSTMQRSKKPILSYIDGMSASLGVFFSSASTEVHFSNEQDEIGSVGSYVTLLDFSGYLEQKGIKMKAIYAPQSEDKNKGYRDALAGDETMIKQDLEFHVDHFISHVKKSRGDLATANEKAWRSGKMFYAKDAIKIGLGDSISSFDKVISKANWLAKRNN